LSFYRAVSPAPWFPATCAWRRSTPCTGTTRRCSRTP
jgi:hypothetical protein